MNAEIQLLGCMANRAPSKASYLYFALYPLIDTQLHERARSRKAVQK